jgi:hypothetical protein
MWSTHVIEDGVRPNERRLPVDIIGIEGAPRQANLSDHFGVIVTDPEEIGALLHGARAEEPTMTHDHEEVSPTARGALGNGLLTHGRSADGRARSTVNSYTGQ